MNDDAKRTLLRMIPHGVYVVTSGSAESGVHGFTATWLTQVSFKPPMVALAVRRDSQSYASITGARSFVVNFLSRESRSIAERFFKPPAVSGTRFGDLPFKAAPVTGAPALDDALGFTECSLLHVYDHGDHSVMVAEVVGATTLRAGDPLRLSDTPWQYGG